jgi:hypothetical protein
MHEIAPKIAYVMVRSYLIFAKGKTPGPSSKSSFLLEVYSHPGAAVDFIVIHPTARGDRLLLRIFSRYSQCCNSSLRRSALFEKGHVYLAPPAFHIGREWRSARNPARIVTGR